MKTKRRAGKTQKEQKPFDWVNLLFGGMVFARGIMAEDRKTQEACGEILNELAGESKTPRRPTTPRRKNLKTARV